MHSWITVVVYRTFNHRQTNELKSIITHLPVRPGYRIFPSSDGTLRWWGWGGDHTRRSITLPRLIYDFIDNTNAFPICIRNEQHLRSVGFGDPHERGLIPAFVRVVFEWQHTVLLLDFWKRCTLERHTHTISPQQKWSIYPIRKSFAGPDECLPGPSWGLHKGYTPGILCPAWTLCKLGAGTQPSRTTRQLFWKKGRQNKLQIPTFSTIINNWFCHWNCGKYLN